MSNEKLASALTGELLAIYKQQLTEMKSGDGINVSLLKEVREFLKQHSIELTDGEAPLQDLSNDVNELADWKRNRDIRRSAG